MSEQPPVPVPKKGRGTTVLIAIVAVIAIFALATSLMQMLNPPEAALSQDYIDIMAYHEQMIQQHETVLRQLSNATQEQRVYNAEVNNWAQSVENRLNGITQDNVGEPQDGQ